MMSRITRVLAVGGLSLVAGVTFAGPAQAATSTGTAGSSAQGAASWRHGDNDVEGYYRSYRSCEWAGERGERRGEWEDYDCVRVRGHRWHRSGTYALVVDYDNDRWDRHGRRH